jgi:hypothetical protein
LVVLGIELSALDMIGRGSTTWVTLPAFFALAIFSIGFCVYALASLTRILLFMLSAQLGWQACPNIPSFFSWLKWSLTNFLSGLDLNYSSPDLHLSCS